VQLQLSTWLRKNVISEHAAWPGGPRTASIFSTTRRTVPARIADAPLGSAGSAQPSGRCTQARGSEGWGRWQSEVSVVTTQSSLERRPRGGVERGESERNECTQPLLVRDGRILEPFDQRASDRGINGSNEVKP
jgi:hypothetical protein